MYAMHYNQMMHLYNPNYQPNPMQNPYMNLQSRPVPPINHSNIAQFGSSNPNLPQFYGQVYYPNNPNSHQNSHPNIPNNSNNQMNNNLQG
jgi:hypothetical protein